ncbi:hypothetical protein, partial [Nocardioides sp.]|uniref:hypothetical protein n=1 Tax=Nocardioides sp. TaxID=35761 RepID=UPI0027348BC9
MQRLSLAVGTLALALTLTACGDSGSDAVATDETPETSAVGYTPTSDVEPHAAVGQDAAAARELLAAAKEGEPVDWAGVGEAFREGGASLKGDGSVRTLAGLAPEHPAFDLTEHAIEGSGPSAGASDGVRGQRVDKGITVLLAAKVSGELDAAAAKIADGDT